jgi:hypothetical protein
VYEKNGVLRAASDEMEGLYFAGQRVPAGTYRELGSFRTVCLEFEDFLPASLNGRVAVYENRPTTFAEMQNQHPSLAKAG